MVSIRQPYGKELPLLPPTVQAREKKAEEEVQRADAAMAGYRP